MPLIPKLTHLDPNGMDSPIIAGLKSLGKTFGLDDPNQIMGVAAPLVTIGPKAIPLDHMGEYARKVASTTIDELAGHANQMTGNTPQAGSTLMSAFQKPAIAYKIHEAQLSPGYAKEAFTPEAAHPLAGGSIQEIIQALADAYHAGIKHSW